MYKTIGISGGTVILILLFFVACFCWYRIHRKKTKVRKAVDDLSKSKRQHTAEEINSVSYRDYEDLYMGSEELMKSGRGKRQPSSPSKVGMRTTTLDE